mmetsp:Transcript_139624/g.246552  ORF Transcript_139624/g.246552 Transcript_139624/m.246552 type:complete len:459 (-) Transcript_139624:71-1447(-)
MTVLEICVDFSRGGSYVTHDFENMIDWCSKSRGQVQRIRVLKNGGVAHDQFFASPRSAAKAVQWLQDAQARLELQSRVEAGQEQSREAESRSQEALRQAQENSEHWKAQAHEMQSRLEELQEQSCEAERLSEQWRTQADELQSRVEALQQQLQETEAHARDRQRSCNCPNLTQLPMSLALMPLLRHGTPLTQMPGGFSLADISEERHALEIAMLKACWEEGGPGGTPTPYRLSRVQAIYSESTLSAFNSKVHQIESRRHGGGPGSPFNAQFEDPSGEKGAVLRLLKAKFFRTDGLSRANVLLVFHGCSHDVANSICDNGFASVSTRDHGYFGAGPYTTTFVQYACDYANGTVDGSIMTPNEHGEYVVVAAWAAPGLTYPISRDADYEPGAEFSNFYQPPPSPPNALKPPFDSHYVRINQPDYQCVDGVRRGIASDFDELVVKEGGQLLPAYLLFFKPL